MLIIPSLLSPRPLGDRALPTFKMDEQRGEQSELITTEGVINASYKPHQIHIKISISICKTVPFRQLNPWTHHPEFLPRIVCCSHKILDVVIALWHEITPTVKCNLMIYLPDLVRLQLQVLVYNTYLGFAAWVPDQLVITSSFSDFWAARY